MLIQRKTTSTFKTAKGRVTFYAGTSTILHGGVKAPTGDPSALLASKHIVGTLDCPELTLQIPGLGHVTLCPAEVAALLTAIDVARAQATVGENFNGRELSRSF